MIVERPVIFISLGKILGLVLASLIFLGNWVFKCFKLVCGHCKGLLINIFSLDHWYSFSANKFYCLNISTNYLPY